MQDCWCRAALVTTWKNQNYLSPRFDSAHKEQVLVFLAATRNYATDHGSRFTFQTSRQTSLSTMSKPTVFSARLFPPHGSPPFWAQGVPHPAARRGPGTLVCKQPAERWQTLIKIATAPRPACPARKPQRRTGPRAMSTDCKLVRSLAGALCALARASERTKGTASSFQRPPPSNGKHDQAASGSLAAASACQGSASNTATPPARLTRLVNGDTRVVSTASC